MATKKKAPAPAIRPDPPTMEMVPQPEAQWIPPEGTENEVHAVADSAGPEDDTATRLRRSFDRWWQAGDEWASSTICLAADLWSARQEHRSNQDFGAWLVAHNLNDLTKDDRSALINIGEHLDAAAQSFILKTANRSPRLIWSEMKKERMRSSSQQCEHAPTRKQPVKDARASVPSAPQVARLIAAAPPEPVELAKVEDEQPAPFDIQQLRTVQTNGMATVVSGETTKPPVLPPSPPKQEPQENGLLPGEQEVIMFGERLWPHPPGNRLHEYRELRTGIWLFQDLQRYLDRSQSDASRAIMIRYLINWVHVFAKHELEGDAHRKIANLCGVVHHLSRIWVENPEGECKFPFTPKREDEPW